MTSAALPATRRFRAARTVRPAPSDHPASLRGLSTSKERELAQRVLAGDKTARNELVVGNLGLAGYFANRYLRWGPHTLEFDDLDQAGREGLVIAVDRYDPETHGTRFSTYAAFWIRQRIRREIMCTGETIRMPVHIHESKKTAEHRLKALNGLTGLNLPASRRHGLDLLVDLEDRRRFNAALRRLPQSQISLLLWYVGRSQATAPKRRTASRIEAAQSLLAKLRARLNPEDGFPNE
jgi:RNA polymerase sigma factor (sigma-70 family)